MRKTWFHGLALTLGATAIPGVVSAQYSFDNTGSGLSSSAFNAGAIANAGDPRSNVPSLPNGQVNSVAYPQNGAVGSGVPGGQVHVPAAPALNNPVPNTQYEAVPPASAPAAQSYEYATTSPVQPSVPSTFPNQTASQSPAVANSYPATNPGSYATKGVGLPNGQIASPVPSYGGANLCYTESAAGCTPSIASPSPWIFGASALLFNRVDSQYARLTSDSTNPDNPILTTNDARMQITGGVLLSGGRYFGNGQYAMVGSYWGVFSNPQTAEVVLPLGGNLQSDLPFTVQGPNPGATPYGITMPSENVYDVYDGAFSHRLVRDQQFHNAELNFFSFALGGGARQPYAEDRGVLLGGSGAGGFGWAGRHGSHGAGAYGSCGDPSASTCGPTGPCAPWYGAQSSKLRLSMFGGLRWFRFQDSFQYAASATDQVYGNTEDDFYYNNGVTNDLVGSQLGAMANWCTGTCVNVFSGTSFGVFCNHMTADTRAGTTDTVATILSANSFNGRAYDYSSSLNDVALLCEGNFGAGIRISRGWTANLGYRVVGVNGVATAVGQIPRDFSNENEINRINNNNSLILHGLVLGAIYNF